MVGEVELDRSQILVDLTLFERSVKAVIDQFEDLISKYNNQWIAVHDGMVVSSSPSHQKVLEDVDRKGLRRSQVNIRYLTDTPPVMVL